MKATRNYIQLALWGLTMSAVLAPSTASAAFGLPMKPSKLGMVSGTVEDASGKPIADAKVSVWNAATRFSAAKYMTDANGWFGGSLPAGAYRVEADKDTVKGEATFSILAGATTHVKVKFGTTAMGTVSGKVMDPDGLPTEESEISIWDAKTGKLTEYGITGAEGGFSFKLPSGSYEVQVIGKFGSAKSAFNIDSGKTTEIKIQLSA